MIGISIVSGIVVPIAATYMIFKGAEKVANDMMNVEKSITTIKFDDWMRVAQ